MSKFVLNPRLLPTHSELVPKGWPDGGERELTVAVAGISSASWFQLACAQLQDVDKDRVARAFAFLALNSVRQCAIDGAASLAGLVQSDPP